MFLFVRYFNLRNNNHLKYIYIYLINKYIYIHKKKKEEEKEEENQSFQTTQNTKLKSKAHDGTVVDVAQFTMLN